jgi:hypothetical protein
MSYLVYDGDSEITEKQIYVDAYGSLSNAAGTIIWSPGEKEVSLRGSYPVEMLNELLEYINKHQIG